MLPASSKKNQTYSNNKQKQSHTTNPSASKRYYLIKRTERISLTKARTRQLEQKVDLQEKFLIVPKNTNSLLEKEVVDLQQYQRRARNVVDGIKPGMNKGKRKSDQGKRAERFCLKSRF